MIYCFEAETVVCQDKQITTLHATCSQMSAEFSKSFKDLLQWTMSTVGQLQKKNDVLEKSLHDTKLSLTNFAYNIQVSV